jgi:serine/threonine-protein kinase HipA
MTTAKKKSPLSLPLPTSLPAQATARHLDVYQNDLLVGALQDTSPLTFRYNDVWLNHKGATALGEKLPLIADAQQNIAVQAYFENLLPEGDIRRLLSISRQATTIFGFLEAVGGDVAGNVSVVSPDLSNKLSSELHKKKSSDDETNYTTTSWTDIRRFYVSPAKSKLNSQIDDIGVRISLAGAQEKLLLVVLANGTPAMPTGAAPSTHILKPDIRRLDSVWASALNETYTMQLAERIGLGVANVTYQPIVKAALIKRYDRILQDQNVDLPMTRLHQLDLCQLDGKTSDVKYESDGGPTLVRCYQLLRESNVPAKDLKRFIQWVFFNLYVGNYDSHAKNLSVLLDPALGPTLAPFYDLMSTNFYSGLSGKFAFNIGGESRPGSIETEHLTRMAAEINVSPKYVMKIGAEMTDAIITQATKVRDKLASEAELGTEQTLLTRLNQHVIRQAKKHKKRWKL